MTKLVPFLPDEAIEKDAQELLAEYAQARGKAIAAPIPIDDIVEKYLKLGLEFDDTHRLFDKPRLGANSDPDILGAIFFQQRRIVVDESLDPDAHPSKEGRYRYTLGHEAGHWRLHRALFEQDPAQASLLDDRATPSLICRSSQAKERIEVQADLYSACVLMPRRLVFAAWDRAFPDRKQRVLKPPTPIDHSFVEIRREISITKFGVVTETDDQALDRFAARFAKEFFVSPIAMRIRLEKVGLLHRAVPLQRLLTDGP